MESLGFRSVVLDPRPQILEVAELVLAGPTAGIERLAVERAADELLEMRVRLELGAQGSDHGRPAVVRQLVAVLAIQLLEREPRRALGVEQEPVEIEEEPADRHGVSLPESPCALTKRTSGPSSSSASCMPGSRSSAASGARAYPSRGSRSDATSSGSARATWSAATSWTTTMASSTRCARRLRTVGRSCFPSATRTSRCSCAAGICSPRLRPQPEYRRREPCLQRAPRRYGTPGCARPSC